MKSLLLINTATLLIFSQNLLADNNTGQHVPCTSSTSLFSLIDRPSKTDSSCTISYGNVMLETGYQYLNLIGGFNNYFGLGGSILLG